jgi:uncharacterized protein YdhG (YjbR/CyaY superfamily)
MATTPQTRYQNVDGYISAQPEHARVILLQLRETIKKAAPEAEEVISYQMPAFRFHGILAWYAAFKNHCGMYIYSRVMQEFKDKLKGYELTKAAIRIPFDRPLHENLVTEIIRFSMNENLDKKYQKELAKTSKTGRSKTNYGKKA